MKQGVLQFFFILFCSIPLWSYNGRVSHLYFEQDQYGNISYSNQGISKSVKLIETNNHFYFFIDPDHPIYQVYFHLGGYNITLLHIIALGISILLQFLSFRKINRLIAQSKLIKRWSLRFIKLMLWAALILGNIGVFLAINYYQTKIHFRYHDLPIFKGKDLKAVQTGLHNPIWFEKQETTQLSTQLYIKKKNKWHTQRENPVLYFKETEAKQLHFSHSSHYLKIREKGILHKIIRAKNQCIVIERINSLGHIHQLFFLPTGQKMLVSKELKKDPAKRILLFVNGYRPVSSSQDINKLKDQILQKGLEHPRSKNLIYKTDHYAYWPNSTHIVQLFKERIEPDVLLFADAHHSVQTSNHLNLLNFTSKASIYPKPCKSQNHHCYTTPLAEQKTIRTYQLLATKSNVEGFMIRYRSGKLAALNLLQELSAYGDQTANDTLYVVSHSMGHAYFCGMVSVLKKHLQFANYYALAPENANAKHFNIKRWRNVFQYGTILYGPRKNAPCQQDGVAPQVKMSGISKRNQIGFPKKYAPKLGYFSSHYVGYFDWIFSIKPQEIGYISKS